MAKPWLDRHKIRIGIDGKTPQIRAAEFTSSDVGNVEQANAAGSREPARMLPLMWLKGSDILRFKAIIHTVEDPHPFVLHGVQHIFSPPVPLPHWPVTDRISRFVVIGRDLRCDVLEESLSFLRAVPVPDQPTDGVLHRLDTPF